MTYFFTHLADKSASGGFEVDLSLQDMDPGSVVGIFGAKNSHGDGVLRDFSSKIYTVAIFIFLVAIFNVGKKILNEEKISVMFVCSCVIGTSAYTNFVGKCMFAHGTNTSVQDIYVCMIWWQPFLI